MKNIKKLITSSRRKAATARESDPAVKSIKKALLTLNQNMSAGEQRASIPFEKFLNELVINPAVVVRNVFQ
ncbi:MAG: hypothetical protein KJO34_12670, partial [Deltaproteobacteria bacterium]|nr:hypothetical protein [Deltaproteobacteria bacterium]